MSSRAADRWMRLGLDAWMLGVEACSVVGLRALRLAAGGAPARAEAERMVQEKIEAGLALQGRLIRGELGTEPARVARGALAHVRRKVRANRRRLSKP